MCTTRSARPTAAGSKSADSANDPKDFGGKRYGIPFGTSGNLINRRADVLERRRLSPTPPKTWEELGEMALKAQKPPETYGMGFALSNVGDGNLHDLDAAILGRADRRRCRQDLHDRQPADARFPDWITDA